MEKSLPFWCEDHYCKNISVSLFLMQSKGISLYENWKNYLEVAADIPEFLISQGCFDKFSGIYQTKY